MRKRENARALVGANGAAGHNGAVSAEDWSFSLDEELLPAGPGSSMIRAAPATPKDLAVPRNGGRSTFPVFASAAGEGTSGIGPADPLAGALGVFEIDTLEFERDTKLR